MRVVVLTVDQHGSQTRPDQVPAALTELTASVPARVVSSRRSYFTAIVSAAWADSAFEWVIPGTRRSEVHAIAASRGLIDPRIFFIPLIAVLRWLPRLG